MRLSQAMIVVLLPISLTLSGCVLVVDRSKDTSTSSAQSEWRETEQSNREQIAALDTGEPLAVVLQKMGTPDFDERVSKEESDYRILFYRTHRVKADGLTTRDECTPLVFENGILIGWGEHKLSVIEGS